LRSPQQQQARKSDIHLGAKSKEIVSPDRAHPSTERPSSLIPRRKPKPALKGAMPPQKTCFDGPCGESLFDAPLQPRSTPEKPE
jgi:hypothetical protein